MQESFLHYIWQFQHFNKKDLKTTDDEPIDIFQTGLLNNNSGPDFTGAKLKIGNMDWAGNVEIHTKSSGWYDHHHDQDPAYENVILHVVWTDDRKVQRSDGTNLPTVILENRVDISLINKYKNLVENTSSIPCEKQFYSVNEIIHQSMLDKALMLRLENRADQINKLLKGSNNDWEEVTYQLIARNFGFKVNYDPFFQLANSISRKLLLKHGDNLVQMEALLFGQAGFLDFGLKEDYPKSLQQEYKMLSAKYGLFNQKLKRENWKFMRLRPANFPTIRIAQFAALYQKNNNLFSKLLEATSIEELKRLFEAPTSDYWHCHYRFGRKTVRSISGMGIESIHNIIINTVAPILVAYGKQHDDQSIIDKAIQFLQDTPGEKNKITKLWSSFGFKTKSAFDSQALIELNNNFCQKRRCLACNIGIAILKPGSQ